MSTIKKHTDKSIPACPLCKDESKEDMFSFKISTGDYVVDGTIILCCKCNNCIFTKDKWLLIDYKNNRCVDEEFEEFFLGKAHMEMIEQTKEYYLEAIIRSEILGDYS